MVRQFVVYPYSASFIPTGRNGHKLAPAYDPSTLKHHTRVSFFYGDGSALSKLFCGVIFVFVSVLIRTGTLAISRSLTW